MRRKNNHYHAEYWFRLEHTRKYVDAEGRRRNRHNNKQVVRTDACYGRGSSLRVKWFLNDGAP